MDLISSDEDLDLADQFRQRSARQFEDLHFEEDVTDQKFREQYRVPRSVLDYLEVRLYDDLHHPTNRSRSLSPRQQIMVYLHFIRCNPFYHILRDVHGLSTHSVFRIVHDVNDALFKLREEFICWPENPTSLPRLFMDIGRE